jgi:hypothetical protein
LSLEKKYSLKDPKGRNWKNWKRQREHDRKDEPKRASVVQNRRGLLFHYCSAPLWVKGCLGVYHNPQHYTNV